MEILKTILDFILHIKDHLSDIITNYPQWFYAVIFLVIFVETGLVVMPFLPGDSLLFAIGALAALPQNNLNVWAIFALLVVAAILGDTLNYHIGKFLGPKVFNDYKPIPGQIKLLNREHLHKAQAFYEKYGGKTIIMARFVPIVRTFAPFVAGIGTMNYGKFIQYNIVGAILWVGVCIAGGYFFGSLPFVEKNFEVVLIAIIGISLVPVIIEVIREKMKKPVA
ncbi:MAG: DedA family protein [Opitutaceae bacterium]|nr:DedA family protein [Cytophagales bacterium]